jgi:drug/metabolite transporter (DMT)-like permease
MVIGGIPLLVISVLNHDPALNGHIQELTSSDILALGYTSIFGSAISYGVYFYNATRGKIPSHQFNAVKTVNDLFSPAFHFYFCSSCR